MLFWFALIGAVIIVFFWFMGKMFDAFDRQDREARAELDSRWYEERDKLIK
jgi:hypothetical protein